MTTDTYHHKDLKNTLLQEGIRLINEQGMDTFSMRKLAAACQVSHMAPYKHFQDKEAFLKAINDYIEQQFYECLKVVAQRYQNDTDYGLVQLGKANVQFMVQHPDYLKYFFLGEHHHEITVDNIMKAPSNCSLGVYRDTVMRYLQNSKVPKSLHAQEILSLWSLTLGLSAMYAYQILEKDNRYLKQVEAILQQEAELRRKVYQ